MKSQKKNNIFVKGLIDGIPIGLGYFAVAFSLGIQAKVSGLNPIEGFIMSLLNYASAGEYAGLTVIKNGSPYIEMVLVILVANCRYILMSLSLSQRVNPKEKFINRIGIGSCITDEIYGLTIAQEGYLKPSYTYGLMISAVFPWAISTALGIYVGSLLPDVVVTALSVSLYGMFIAIIIPPAKKDKVLFVLILVSFILSYLFSILFPSISEGIRIIILTIVISVVFSIVKPIKED